MSLPSCSFLPFINQGYQLGNQTECNGSRLLSTNASFYFMTQDIVSEGLKDTHQM